MREDKFAIRTVKNGRVKIGGLWFTPSIGKGHRPYNGELDGMKLAFARYKMHGKDGPYEPFIALWGSEKAYRCMDPEATEEEQDWPGPNCIDGTFYWGWWEAVA